MLIINNKVAEVRLHTGYLFLKIANYLQTLNNSESLQY